MAIDAPTPNMAKGKEKPKEDLKITHDDLKQGQHVSSHMATALLGMNKFKKLEAAMEEVRQENLFSDQDLDELDHYHKLVVEGVGKETSLLFSFDFTRRVNEPAFNDLKSEYYEALGEKLGLENGGEVRDLVVERSAIRCHLYDLDS